MQNSTKTLEYQHDKTKFVATPRVQSEISKLKAYFEVMKEQRSPILVLGASGTGKSLFIYVFKKLLKMSFEKAPIVVLDCAHLIGADPHIARSALFGHTKGAFTGAIREEKGVVEKADKGALILDEVGELPKDVQAMLLTFIETGKYRKLGGEKEEESNAWILAATGNEQNLRPELRYRFFPFHLTPLHQRREEILLYFAHMFPDMLRTLTPSQILALLAYHWPGNMREIEGVIKGFKIRKSGIIKGEFTYPLLLLFYMQSVMQGKPYEGFDPSKAQKLYVELEKNGIDVKGLDKLLRRYGIALGYENRSHPFKGFQSLKTTTDKDLGVTNIFHSKEFGETITGLGLFAGLFKQNLWENSDILDNVVSGKFSEVELGDFKVPNKLLSSVNSFIAWKKSGESHQPDISSMNWISMKRYYFEEVLRKSGGNKSMAARTAGVPTSTFLDWLKKAGIKL